MIYRAYENLGLTKEGEVVPESSPKVFWTWKAKGMEISAMEIEKYNLYGYFNIPTTKPDEAKHVAAPPTTKHVAKPKETKRVESPTETKTDEKPNE